ncbi:glycosyltransferase family 4 protein [Methylobacterium mesophilicum SR1.6/6]|uniref:Glycosyltransferase family 4 protein n=1 Tax=Methylobacterium mesophilicum SR1.6/6 TaxID=908290 RepID=A0A6B9FQ23_9HYPH|nr:glycosyltransferase family 4 protein [Methylobacterium mesophilicum]QGY04691.1 glycosyltransferase family 4 protein [Methylobacterium mesophilicum SR1.6/6]
MKIIHILNHTKKSNGHVHAAVDLACEQARLDHAVLIASAGGDFDDLLQDNKVGTRYLAHRRKIHLVPSEMLAFYRLLRKDRPDIVHAHMMTSAVLAWPSCMMLGIPLITTVHNEFERSSILMGLGKKVIAVSEAVKKSMSRRGIKEKKLAVVLNGTIGSARLKSVDRKQVSLSKPNVMFVGGLHPRKGLIDLFDAFEIVYRSRPNCKLYIVGGGPMIDTYTKYVSDLSSANSVEFLGTIQQPVSYLAAADIFVLPSHADPAPLVISEAREAGCAVIATDVDGIPQLLNDGKAGILVPARRPDALAREMLRLLDDPQQLAFWKIQSQNQIQYLTISRVCAETIEVYKSAL